MKFHCFYKTAIQKDDREPTFPHYRIRTIDWSQLILINIKVSDAPFHVLHFFAYSALGF